MQLFLWERLSGLTENYHNEGGLVIVAETLARAWEMEKAAQGHQPDATFKVEATKEQRFYFPDAGCC